LAGWLITLGLLFLHALAMASLNALTTHPIRTRRTPTNGCNAFGTWCFHSARSCCCAFGRRYTSILRFNGWDLRYYTKQIKFWLFWFDGGTSLFFAAGTACFARTLAIAATGFVAVVAISCGMYAYYNRGYVRGDFDLDRQ
jgi:hypothetical protein